MTSSLSRVQLETHLRDLRFKHPILSRFLLGLHRGHETRAIAILCAPIRDLMAFLIVYHIINLVVDADE